ncbi:cupin-like domain-containing protein [Nannocystis pusilla]|uniref:cupin-like domain-containing protein n=1 Tax=Nannocystis pusilla TaxID=889268 RepID=UPI003DA31197
MPYNEYLEIEALQRPSLADFRARFLRPQMPVKISGAIDDWPAFKHNKWTLDFFAANFGHETVGIERFEPGERGEGKNSPQDYVKHLKFQDMKVGELIRILKEKPDHMYYMAQHPFRRCFKGLRADIHENPYLRHCIKYIPGAHMDSYLWIGPRGTMTPLHQDPMPNFLIQLVGRKLVYLFPPEQARKNLYIGQFERPSFSPVNVEAPDLEAYPNYRDCTPYRTVIEPGEMLHIPRNWGHAVRSLDISISISSFFITYGQLFKLLPEYVSDTWSRLRDGRRWDQVNERAGVNAPPRNADGRA